jgi:CPA1 family monovalent cation:H+ antiporter
MWEIVDFLLNGVLFVLVGLQLHRILGTLAPDRAGTLLLDAGIIVLTVVVLRVVWVFAFASLPRRPLPTWGATRPRAPWQETAVVAWTGMRGAVSLAAALAVPLAISGGAGFPQRDLIIYLTFAVILATLVPQGLTLPIMIRRLGIAPGPGEQHEELAARLAATQAGLERLNSGAKDGVPAELIDGLRAQLLARTRRFVARANRSESRAQRTEAARYRRLLREVLDAERGALIDLRDQDIISDDVMRRVGRELDLDEARLEPEDGDGPR